MSAKVVVIVEDKYARFRSGSFAEKVCGGETADAATNNDQVIFFVQYRSGIRRAPRKFRRAGYGRRQKILDGSRAIPLGLVDSSLEIFRGPSGIAAAASKSEGRIAAPTVSATPFRKSRRVISRRIPSSRSFRSFIGKSFIETSRVLG